MSLPAVITDCLVKVKSTTDIPDNEKLESLSLYSIADTLDKLHSLLIEENKKKDIPTTISDEERLRNVQLLTLHRIYDNEVLRIVSKHETNDIDMDDAITKLIKLEKTFNDHINKIKE